MRFTPIIFSKLLAPINRRQFSVIVARHAGDAYDKGSGAGTISWR